MTEEIVKALLFEARQLGHAEAKTKRRKACAIALATQLRAVGHDVAPRTGTSEVSR